MPIVNKRRCLHAAARYHRLRLGSWGYDRASLR